jgi:uncharacterized membrane protein YfcA
MQESSKQAVTKRRPTGVSIITVLMWIGGASAIIVALLAMRNGPALGAFELVLGIATISVGWGLWSLKHWAYRASVILFILLTLASLYGLFGGTHLPTGVLVFHLALRGFILIYLLVDSNMRKAFRPMP